jgi:gram-positive specific serine protease
MIVEKINSQDCGPCQEDRIKGGKKAKVGQFPWMALLIYQDTDTKKISYGCGGSLITPSFVLTAAHCFSDRNFKL